MAAESKQSHDNYPIFQADYLLIRHESELLLHRVTHGLMIDDATSAEAMFTTTEYEHTSQAGVRGLFGTFVPKVSAVADNTAHHSHTCVHTGVTIRVERWCCHAPL